MIGTSQSYESFNRIVTEAKMIAKIERAVQDLWLWGHYLLQLHNWMPKKLQGHSVDSASNICIWTELKLMYKLISDIFYLNQTNSFPGLILAFDPLFFMNSSLARVLFDLNSSPSSSSSSSSSSSIVISSSVLVAELFTA